MRFGLRTLLCLSWGLALALIPSRGSAAPTTLGATAAAPAATGATLASPATPADAALRDASSLAAAGKFQQAIAKLEPMRHDPSFSPRAQSLLGALYGKVNRPREALEVLRPLADAKDANPAVLYNAGMAALALKQATAAQNYFTRAVAQDPTTPATRELGLILARQGRVVEAYAMLRPWSLRNPTDGEPRLTAAALALQLERPVEAEQMIANMDPNDPGIVLMRAKVLVQKGDGKSAVPLLTPLMTQHPPGMEPEVRRTLAEADVLAGNPAAAVELLKGRVDGHPAVALVLATAQHRNHDVLGALVTLRPFADQLPPDAKGLGDPRPAGKIAIEYGRLLVDAGRSPEGVVMLEKATKILPQNEAAWRALSEAYGAAGRKNESQLAAARAEAIANASAAVPATPAAAPAAPGKPPGR